MRRRLANVGGRSGLFAGLVLAALLVGFFVVLPLGHQLFHDGAVEPESCPIHLLESSLLLLFLAVLALVLFGGGQRPPLLLPLIARSQGFRGFFFNNRAPPPLSTRFA
mgnify:CR=1 FL=1